MICKSGFWRMVFAAFVPMLAGTQAMGQEVPRPSTQTVTVVVSDDDGKPSEALDQIRKQLKSSGMSEDAQKKILAQVEEAMARAASATSEAVKAGKAAANAARHATEQVNIDLHGVPLNMDDLRNRIEAKIKGRFQYGGQGTGPSYRIGISLAQRQHEDDKDEDEDEDEVEDEDEDEHEDEGMVVEQVMDDSPAKKAGIEEGDMIVWVNGKALDDFTELQDAVREAGESDKALVLMLRRDGKEKKVKVKPEKTEGSDVGFMEMELMPQQGLVVNGIPLPSLNPWTNSSSDDLKKEIAELKEDIGELKKMVKKLLEK
jgi:C-terminal processing protease CtpA/Prc